MPEAQSPAGVAAPDDETLVGLARQGSRPACEELFQRHRGVAYRVAFRLLGNEQDALDAVQDGLLKAFSGLRRLRRPQRVPHLAGPDRLQRGHRPGPETEPPSGVRDRIESRHGAEGDDEPGP